MTKRRSSGLMAKLEIEALAMLNATDLTRRDKLKAMEVAAKVLQIKHKISEGDQVDGAFFSGK